MRKQMTVEKVEHPKIDKEKQKQITEDWLKEFPFFKKFGSRQWKRRVGPIVLSMGFDVKNVTWNDKPCYEVGGSYCNLLKAPEFLYATLGFEPKTTHTCNITWQKHVEDQRYKKAAQELREQAPIPLDGPVTLSQILNAYRLCHEQGNMYIESWFYDPPLIAAWAGREKLAEEWLVWAIEAYRVRLEKQYEARGQEVDKNILKAWIPPWVETVKEKIASSENLKRILEEQIIKHKLQKIPYEDLIIDV